MMKKQALLVALASLTLVGCGKTTVPASSSESATATATATATSETTATSTVDPADSALAPFIAKVVARNATVEVKDWCNYKFFGTDALLATYEGTYAGETDGAIRVGTQGLFKFSIASNAIVLGDCLSVAADVNIDTFYWTTDALADASLWTKGVGYAWTSTSSAVGGAMAGLNGYGSYASLFDSYASTLTIAEDGATASIVTTAKAGTKSYPLTADFSNLGTTTDTVIEAYLKNPPTLSAATDWSAAVKTSLTTWTGEVLPFPEGTSYATAAQAETDDDGNETGFDYFDYASGDILDKYQLALVSAGWALSDRTTAEDDMTKDGYVHYLYEKTKTEQTATAGRIVYNIQVEFQPVSTMGTSSAALYPNGEFKIFCSTYEYPIISSVDADGLNAYLATILKTDKSQAIPTLTIGTEVTTIKIEDSTNIYNASYGSWGFSWTKYATITLTISTQAEAEAAATAYGAALAAAGFTAGTDTLAKEGDLIYTLADDLYANNFSGALSITLMPKTTGTDTAKTYDGALEMIVEA